MRTRSSNGSCTTVKNLSAKTNGLLTLTVGADPNVFHAVVEQLDQHQSVAAQEAVPAAFVARTHLEAKANFNTHLTAHWCSHEYKTTMLLEKKKRSQFSFP